MNVANICQMHGKPLQHRSAAAPSATSASLRTVPASSPSTPPWHGAADSIRVTILTPHSTQSHGVTAQRSGQRTRRRFKIYTKTGDGGTSSLYNGERKPKTDAVFAALGDVDELNACVGVAAEYCRAATAPPAAATDGARSGEGPAKDLVEQLREVQSRLLDVGSAVATPLDASSERKVSKTAFAAAHVDTVERWIDALDEDLPALTQFILPGGGKAAAHLHVARATCRRAERAVVALGGDHVPQEVRTYLNRLSDYFFTAARAAAQAAGEAETTYRKAA